MIPGPFSFLNSRSMLDIHLRPRPLYASPCVAPKDVFPDYSNVIAGLTGDEKTPLQDEDVSATTFEERGIQLYNMNDNVHTSIHAEFDDRGYRGKQQEREAAADISNSYSGLVVRKERSERKPQRPKPYDRTSSLKVSAEERNSPTQCPYIAPRSGDRCKKVIKSSQERGRHWRSCHVFKEAKSILEGRLDIGEGFAITTPLELERVKQLIQCSQCGAIITRSDSMKRHIKNNCKAFEAS